MIDTLTFLIADDDIKTINKIKRAIGRIWNNANTLTSTTVQETINVLKTETIDVLLLDLDFQTPNEDGYTVLEYLNNTNKIQDIIVIVISSLPENESIKKVLQLGAFDFISKENIGKENGNALFEARVNHGIQVLSTKKLIKQAFVDEIAKEKVEQEALLSVMATLLSKHNQETGEHVMRVQEYTRIILNKLLEKGYLDSDLDIETIVHATALHDVGKIMIPVSVLNKPGKLTQFEYTIMKAHAEAGHQILSEDIQMYKDNEVVKYAMEIAKHHHERWHGYGYPDALTNKDIPLYVQAVSLADSYDAIHAKRCYTESTSHEETIKKLKTPYDRNNSGQPDYSPIILEVLDDVADELKEASEKELKEFEIEPDKVATDIVNKIFSLSNNGDRK